MKSRHVLVAVVWVVSLVGVGLWAQAPGRAVDTSEQSAQVQQIPPAQTGTIEGTVADATGGAIPGATVVLINEMSGARRVPGVTNREGLYLFRSVPPGTYTVEVTMPGFRTVRRPGVAVSGGTRVAIPTMTLEVAAAARAVPIPPAVRPGGNVGPIISGPDIGFQPVVSPNTPAGVVTGRLMVRIDGTWYEASAAMQVVPAR